MTDPLTAWLEAYAPHLAESFAPPVDSPHLDEATAALGRALPESYVRFLREHDGQRWVEGPQKGTGTLASIFDAFDILGIRQAHGEWRSMHDWGDADAVRFWPFTTIGGESTHHAFDEEGRVCVVSMKDPARPVLAESFDAFLERLVVFLEEESTTIDREGIDLDDEAFSWLLGSA